MRSMELVGRERMDVAVRPNSEYDLGMLWGILTSLSNNFPFGANPATTMCRMLRINWVFLSTRLASLKTNLLTATTNIG